MEEHILPLRRVPIFADLSEDDLRRLAAGVDRFSLKAGETLFEEGEPGALAYVICDGDLEIVKATEGREVVLAVRGPGNVIGEMALIDAAPRAATVRARTDASLLAVPKTALDEVLESSPGATRALFQVLLDRWRQTESRLRQSQRMAQLGTLTAGLTHELNNPAGAILRAAQQLGGVVEDYETALKEAIRVGSGVIADEHLVGLLAPGEPADLSPLARSDREAEMEDALSAAGIDQPWQFAADLVDAGADVEGVSALTARHGPEAAAATVAAAAAGQRIRALIREVVEGSSRLSAIVAALKSYSFLDRAPLQEVDVRRGLDDTLMIMKHRLDGISVETDYSDELPAVTAQAPSLNQVWTNLIDNAASALISASTPDPRIVVRAGPAEEGGVVVEIEDNGPGVPADFQSRIFDPFFTTKPPGEGTGLGLDISYGIVVHEHRGDITVESEPGRTLFRVSLPANRPPPRSDS